MPKNYMLGLLLAGVALLAPRAATADDATCKPSDCEAIEPTAAQCTIAAGTLAAAEMAFANGEHRRAYAEASCLLKRHSASGQEIRALHVAGRAAVRLGCDAAAQRALRRALELSARPPDAHGGLRGRSLIYLGDYYERQKQHELALMQYRQALAVLDLRHEAQVAIQAWYQMGDIEIARGRFVDGIRHYESALAHAGTPAQTAQALDYLGYAHRRLGDFDKALGFHRRALEVSGAIPAGPERAQARARAHNHSGLVLQSRAQAEAREDVRRALATLMQAAADERAGLAVLAQRTEPGFALQRKGYLLRALSRIHVDLAALQTERRQRHLAQALNAASAGLQVGRDMGDKEWQALALHALADVHAQLGRRAESEATLHEAIPLWQCLGDRYSLGHAWSRLALNVSLPHGDLAGARDYLQRALELFSAIQMRDDVVATHVALGRVHERGGDLPAARSAYYSAIEVLEDTRARLATEESRIAFFAQRTEAYEALIALLVRGFREHGARADGEEAFRISESARGRVLLDLVTQSNAALTARVDAAVLAQERRLLGEIERLRERLAAPAHEERALARLRIGLHEAEERLARFYRSLEQRYPDYARLKRPVVATLHTVRERVLRPGEVLLEYFIGARESFVFVVKPEGLAAILPLAPTRQELTRDVERLRAPFAAIKSARDPGAFIVSARSFDLALAEKLYAQLYAPVEPYVGAATRVLLVPDGPLFHLPFEMLVARKHSAWFGRFTEDVRNSEFLVDRAPPIAYTLSASLLLDARRHGEPRRQLRTVAFVNPRTPYRRLASVPEEVKKLKGLLGAERWQEYQDRLASKTRFLRAAGHFDSFYIATHGEFDEAQPLNSGFWLSDEKQEKGTLVSAADIFGMPLRAELFVLRACETGVGRIRNGEGVLGLARALKYAGVRGMILSLWAVDDASSSDLMVSFYGALSRDQGHAHALHAAKRGLRGAPTAHLAHPFFWAPFTYWI